MPTPYALSSDLVSAWPAKSLAIATYLDDTLASKTDLAMTQNAQTGTTYSFALADASKLLTTSNASPVSVTVTKQATVTWVTGTQLRIMNLGAGVTTLVADTGVTINGNVSLNQYQGGTLIRTASDVWLFVPTASSSGMDLITPTSVAGSGVSFSGGLVSFTAATEVDVNGCFTSAYDHYQVIWDIRSSSASNQLNMRLRASGSNAATDYYCSLVYAPFNANSVAGEGTGIGTTIMWAGYLQTAVGNSGIMNVRRPAVAATTMWSMQGGNYAPAGYPALSGGYHTTASAYDGFALIPAAGNITGNVRVYGMRNS